MSKHRNPNQALSRAIIMCNSKKQTMGGFVSSTKPLRLYEGSSEPLKSSGLGKAHPEYATLVKLMLPVYYVPDPLTDEQLTLATTVWKAVLNNEAPRYQKQCRDDSFASEYPTALEFFTVTFFRRLFDIHPIFVTALSKVKDREHFTRLAIDFILSAESDQKVFELALERFAHVHHVRGVRAAECEFTAFIVLHLTHNRWHLRRSAAVRLPADDGRHRLLPGHPPRLGRRLLPPADHGSANCSVIGPERS